MGGQGVPPAPTVSPPHQSARDPRLGAQLTPCGVPPHTPSVPPGPSPRCQASSLPLPEHTCWSRDTHACSHLPACAWEVPLFGKPSADPPFPRDPAHTSQVTFSQHAMCTSVTPARHVHLCQSPQPKAPCSPEAFPRGVLRHSRAGPRVCIPCGPCLGGLGESQEGCVRTFRNSVLCVTLSFNVTEMLHLTRQPKWVLPGSPPTAPCSFPSGCYHHLELTTH